MTKIILVVLVIAATLTECIVMRKSREYDAADNIAGLERCVKAMVVLGLVGLAAKKSNLFMVKKFALVNTD